MAFKSVDSGQVFIKVAIREDLSLYNRRTYQEKIDYARELVEEIESLACGVSVTLHFKQDMYCEHCGLKRYVQDTADELYWYEGHLLVWHGMPLCCDDAQYEWAKDNPPMPPISIAAYKSFFDYHNERILNEQA